MKPETLESLLIDRALGELGPEVSELLGSFLARTPEATRQAGQWEEAVRQARVATATLQPPPGLRDASWVRPALGAQRRRAITGAWIRMAACVALGLVLGWAGHRRPERAPVAAAPAPATVPAGEAPAASGGDFWSLAKLEGARGRRAADLDRVGDGPRLQWKSPAKMPQVEDN